jgi:hypothetical protein
VAAARTWQPPAVLALRPLLARIAALPTPDTQQYRRVEAPADAPLPTARTIAEARFPAGEAPVLPAPSREGVPSASGAATAGERLPAVVQERLRGLVGPPGAAMRVHHDAAADAFARTSGADAVAVGPDVYFRTGRYHPLDRDGLALVAHEATHVAESAASAATWRRATGRGAADEEQAARAVERLVAGADGSPGGHGAVTAAVVPLAAGPVPVPAVVPPAATAPPPATVPGGVHVLTAAEGRDIEGAGAVPGVDVEELRRVLYQDMIGQLRVEFERGA